MILNAEKLAADRAEAHGCFVDVRLRLDELACLVVAAQRAYCAGDARADVKARLVAGSRRIQRQVSFPAEVDELITDNWSHIFDLEKKADQP